MCSDRRRELQAPRRPARSRSLLVDATRHPGPSRGRTIDTYLVAIYLLVEEGVQPIQARLAERLDHSGAAVSEMVHRLRDEGLIARDGRVLALSAAGLLRAEASVRRHRLIERFLTDVVGLAWERAHGEATRWEPVVSDEVAALLIEILAEPTTSSLGTPIPGARPNAEKATPREVALLDAPVGVSLRVARLTEALQDDDELVRFLARIGVAPGALVVTTRHVADGTVVQSSVGEVTIPAAASRHVFLAPLASRI